MNYKPKVKIYDIQPYGLKSIVDLRDKEETVKKQPEFSYKKIVILFLIVALCWTALTAIGNSLALLNDTEDSVGN